MTEEFAEYMPHIRRRWQMEQKAWERRREDAWPVARRIAAWLRDEFHASEVIAFGSLVDTGPFDSRSDIDLAASGLAFRDYLMVLVRAPALAPDFKIDIVDLDECPAALRQVILTQGVIL